MPKIGQMVILTNLRPNGSFTILTAQLAYCARRQKMKFLTLVLTSLLLFVAGLSACDTSLVHEPDMEEIKGTPSMLLDESIEDESAESCGPVTVYYDGDGDGAGDSNKSGKVGYSCLALPTGWVLQSGDCDAHDEYIYPGAEEICNGVDDDCDLFTDRHWLDIGVVPGSELYWADMDGDGIGAGDSRELCPDRVEDSLTWFVDQTGDCDDNDPNVGGYCETSVSEEVCNGLDDNNNGLIDDDSTDGIMQCPDDDWDGLGSNDSTLMIRSCSLEPGYVPWDGDCDDENPDIPHFVDDGYAVEIVGNNADDDCDGITE